MHEVPGAQGHHRDLMEEPFVGDLAREMAASLAQIPVK